MSHENLIDGFLRETGMAASTLATLSNINRTRVSQCLRGQASFTGPEAVLLTNLVRELRSIVRDTQPIPIDWADCAGIQKLLEHKRQGIKWATTATAEAGNDAV